MTHSSKPTEPPPSPRPKTEPLLHVVLDRPEIPNNTGTIGRCCVATSCALHLVHPLGFDVSEKACRRAGLDYWPRLDVREHADWAAYESTRPTAAGVWFLSTRATKPVYEAEIRAGDHLVFGRETAGLDQKLLDAHPERVVGLPMVAGERSQNLANAAAAVVYEGIRQMLARGEARLDASGRLERAGG